MGGFTGASKAWGYLPRRYGALQRQQLGFGGFAEGARAGVRLWTRVLLCWGLWVRLSLRVPSRTKSLTLILIMLILRTSPRLSRPIKLTDGLYYLLPILQCNFALGKGIICLHRCCERFNTQTCGTLGGVSVSSASPSLHVVSVAIALSASSSTCVAQALSKYSRDLTQAAREGKLDPVIGRDDEIRRTVQILSRRTKNNPILLGEPGAVIE